MAVIRAERRMVRATTFRRVLIWAGWTEMMRLMIQTVRRSSGGSRVSMAFLRWVPAWMRSGSQMRGYSWKVGRWLSSVRLAMICWRVISPCMRVSMTNSSSGKRRMDW